MRIKAKVRFTIPDPDVPLPAGVGIFAAFREGFFMGYGGGEAISATARTDGNLTWPAGAVAGGLVAFSRVPDQAGRQWVGSAIAQALSTIERGSLGANVILGNLPASIVAIQAIDITAEGLGSIGRSPFQEFQEDLVIEMRPITEDASGEWTVRT